MLFAPHKILETNLYRSVAQDTVVLIEEDQVQEHRRLADVILVFLVLLFAESARGIVLPTLAPFVDDVCNR